MRSTWNLTMAFPFWKRTRPSGRRTRFHRRLFQFASAFRESFELTSRSSTTMAKRPKFPGRSSANCLRSFGRDKTVGKSQQLCPVDRPKWASWEVASDERFGDRISEKFSAGREDKI